MTRSTAPGVSTLGYDEPVIFSYRRDGHKGPLLPATGIPSVDPEDLFEPELVRREPARLPQAAEPEVVRHFTRLSTWNYSVDHGVYPLGSCTMKYNPKLNEWAARLDGFARLHPYTPDSMAQGALALLWHLQRDLAELTGLDAVSLQPAAGAHGELTAMMCIQARLRDKGERRTKVLVPDTAHGTNPATAALNGLQAVAVPSGPDGLLEPQTVAALMDEDVAALMITNPNTLGLFERHIADLCGIVHAKGGYVFGDGANFNAIMGRMRPGDAGIDAVHLNLHKSFSTPHGGGGPGAGPVAVCAELAPYLPGPMPVRREDGTFALEPVGPASIGKVRSFWGNFAVAVRAYAYLRTLGAAGVRAVADTAVLNANYLAARLAEAYHIPYGVTGCMHEVVASDKHLAPYGVTTLDVAKALIDRGFHPPTIYFPLVVKGALMCEPTETETKQSIDAFADALVDIARQAADDPESLHDAPVRTKVSRLDEAAAARKPVLAEP